MPLFAKCALLIAQQPGGYKMPKRTSHGEKLINQFQDGYNRRKKVRKNLQKSTALYQAMCEAVQKQNEKLAKRGKPNEKRKG